MSLICMSSESTQNAIVNMFYSLFGNLFATLAPPVGAKTQEMVQQCLMYSGAKKKKLPVVPKSGNAKLGPSSSKVGSEKNDVRS